MWKFTVSFWKLKTLILITAVSQLPSSSRAALCSRIFNFQDGQVLTASQLNQEFNNSVNCSNSIDNANVVSSAAINPQKISSTIAGDGISRDGSTGVLSVGTDGTSIEISSDALQVKANGISDAKIRQSAALSVIGRSANTLGNVADIAASNDGEVLRRSGTSIGFGTIATAGITDGAVTQAKREAVPTAVSSSCGAVTTSSTSYADIPNLSVTYTSTGRLAIIVAEATGGSGYMQTSSTTTSYQFSMKLLKGGVDTQEFFMGPIIGAANGSFRYSPPTMMFFDIPSAGSTTYKLQWKVTAGTTTLNCINLRLRVVEL